MKPRVVDGHDTILSRATEWVLDVELDTRQSMPAIVRGVGETELRGHYRLTVRVNSLFE